MTFSLTTVMRSMALLGGFTLVLAASLFSATPRAQATVVTPGWCWNHMVGWIDMSGVDFDRAARTLTGEATALGGGPASTGTIDFTPQAGTSLSVDADAVVQPDGSLLMTGQAFSEQYGWLVANHGSIVTTPISVTANGTLQGNFWSNEFGWFSCSASDLGGAAAERWDISSFIITPESAVINENAATTQFTIRLGSQPTSDVVFDLSTSDAAEAVIFNNTITFSPANWNDLQIVTVQSVDDTALGLDYATITIAVADAASDDAFDDLADKTFALTLLDDDANSNDIDGDGIPNDQDPDMDGDGIVNVLDPDTDGDGDPNVTDLDDDNDGIADGSDSTPTGPGTIGDLDGDGIPDATDPDIDGDGILNIDDPDIDGDGDPNVTDPDDDGDGIPDGTDPTPTGTGTIGDMDGDGIPDATDPDMDGDGIVNVLDPDTDGDGILNTVDGDDDNDGTLDGADPTPTGFGTLADYDGDGIPNATDPDMDGDGIPNGSDPDLDGDGIPNATDPDDDNDGVPDVGSGGGGGAITFPSQGGISIVCNDPAATNFNGTGSCAYDSTPPVVTPPTTPPTTGNEQIAQEAKTCTPLVSQNMRLGRDNDPEQVKVLQNFLNKHEGTSLSVDGVFSQAVHDAVVSFQEKHSGDVLDFWNINAGTGYVFYTTRAKMNAINCAEKKPTLSCPYFEYFTDLGEASDSVKRVQIFLNENEGENLSVTGQYDQSTKDAISRYQDKYASEILSPWNISAGTGLFLQTTRKHMHRQMGCFELPVRLPNGVVVE